MGRGRNPLGAALRHPLRMRLARREERAAALRRKAEMARAAAEAGEREAQAASEL